MIGGLFAFSRRHPQVRAESKPKPANIVEEWPRQNWALDTHLDFAWHRDKALKDLGNLEEAEHLLERSPGAGARQCGRPGGAGKGAQALGVKEFRGGPSRLDQPRRGGGRAGPLGMGPINKMAAARPHPANSGAGKRPSQGGNAFPVLGPLRNDLPKGTGPLKSQVQSPWGDRFRGPWEFAMLLENGAASSWWRMGCGNGVSRQGGRNGWPCDWGRAAPKRPGPKVRQFFHDSFRRQSGMVQSWVPLGERGCLSSPGEARRFVSDRRRGVSQGVRKRTFLTALAPIPSGKKVRFPMVDGAGKQKRPPPQTVPGEMN
jgi:hypothetical protein